MTQMMIEVPEDLKAKLRTRAIQSGFSDTQQFVIALLEAGAGDGEAGRLPVPAHLTFDSKSELEKMLVEGIKSGDFRDISPTEWNEKQARLKDRFSKPGPT
jgi:hypothetical protein